jgi:outer membrane immunogenic protein
MRQLAIILASTSALVALAAPAFANDLPTRAAQTPAATQAFAAVPPPVFNWTGYYIGANVGYSWGSARSEFDFPGIPVAGVPVGRFSNSDKANLNGAIGGFQAGYNWQTAPNWLWGLETDFQWSGEKGSGSFSHHDEFNFPAGLFFLETDQNTRYTAKITWFGTVRGRLGYVMDRFVIFGTGGFAYGNVKVDGSSALITTCCSGPGISPTSTVGSDFSESKVKGGWTLGGGIEGVAWDPRWTWKIEYLYLDLGTLRVSEDPLVKVSTKFTDNIVRFGLNFHY